ncbi:type I-E CRISPR-associated endonuclease Cas1e [Meiothermus sp. CFH 77666]|uniref:type I-E CRISPR-associated endonuclease Cas1e n=1 Tax=Meiothermus sp. CFH 77666 TaxID=2817942 RepID=UPI001AA09D06|nr:type I-E CRISPR-associated endonuclease Cas1e [Meiothermus sp. CFH 77666]MBO1437425.1 type I-E CRISPR-associated endonuclease Cas1 [Meiothermus sp. CFH 77666]
MNYETRNLQELPKFRDGLSYLYLEHGRLEQQDQAVAFYTQEGVVSIPAAALGVLLLGPGTSVTHAAIRQLANNGCSVFWVGEEMVRFYASGMGETRSSAHLMRQVQAWADPKAHLEVVKRMYRMRFPEGLPADLTLEQIRGREGVRVRDTYARWSRETGVPWKGRNYNRGNWADADPINRALSAGAACLYGLCHAAIVSAGYSPALGFIHTGKQLSFVYDIADLYKAETLVPTAFTVVAESEQAVERRVRHALRDHLKRIKLLDRVVDDLHRLFDALELPDPYAADPALPGELWDPEGSVPGGTAYGSEEQD